MQQLILGLRKETKISDALKTKNAFGTYEWASYNANFISGCIHNCKYCYSKEMAIRFGRTKPSNWHEENIRKGSLSKIFKKIDGTIMFPSSHDIHPSHLDEALIFLENILKPGNKVLIVSKPHLECIKAICSKFYKSRNNIMFRFTIGSTNSDVLNLWEPNAPNFSERVASLKWAYKKDFMTSVSCEPMLDNNVDALIKKVSPYVTDAIWIGKANFLLRRLKVNHAADKETLRGAYQLINWQSNVNIIDLYNAYKNNCKIKWKESIKKVVGIELPKQNGMDI